MVRSPPNPSFYIPRVHKSISRETIKAVFENTLGENTVGRIDIEPSYFSNSRGQSFRSSWNKVIVYVNSWQPHTHNIRDALLNDETIEIDCLSIIGYAGNPTWRCFRNTKPNAYHKTAIRINYPHHQNSIPKYVPRDCKSCGEIVHCEPSSLEAQDPNGLSTICNNCSSSQVSMFQRWQQPLG